MGVRFQIKQPCFAAVWRAPAPPAVLLAGLLLVLLPVLLSGHGGEPVWGEAAAQQPNVPPVPEPRPPVRFAEPQNLLVAKPEEDSEADPENTTPEPPRPKPGDGSEPPVSADLPVIAPGLLLPVSQNAEEIEACRWRLRALELSFDRWPTIARGGQCRIELPLLIRELSPGLAVDPEAIMSCQLAETLATWMRDIVVPAAARHLSGEVTGLVMTSAFHCRSGGPDALVDAHASGSAVDITGLTFKQRDPLAIRDRRAENGPESAFQREILSGACKLFTTVLSPGAEFGTTESDARHFHFDVSIRRDGQRICR